MRVILAVVALALAPTALAGSTPAPTVLPKPGFPAPAGYGFTAEPDFLYLLDRGTGKVLERRPLPSAPEIVKLRGSTLHVRTYHRQVVAKIGR